MVVLPPSGFRRGFADLMNAYNSQRVGAATVALGLADGAYQHALDYANAREQFGRPIAEFQGLQWMLADMSVQISAARELIYKAARSVLALPRSAVRRAGQDLRRRRRHQGDQRRAAGVRRGRLFAQPAAGAHGPRRPHVHHRRRHRADFADGGGEPAFSGGNCRRPGMGIRRTIGWRGGRISSGLRDLKIRCSPRCHSGTRRSREPEIHTP